MNLKIVTILFLGILLVLDVAVVEGQDEEEEVDSEDGGDDTVEEGGGEESEDEPEVLTCFDCSGVEECADVQHPSNGTITECPENENCWVWKTQNGNETADYRRGCGEICTDKSRELDCVSADNITECTLCCSKNNCNDGQLNSSPSTHRTNHMIPILIISFMFQYSFL